MKLLRTIRLDPSDTFVFERAAEPGEWAVSGAFVFWNADAGEARRQGARGVSRGLSRRRVARLVDAGADRRGERGGSRGAVELLAQQLVEHFGAPDLATARAAAEEEVAFAASLCNHPTDTLIAVHRSFEDGEMREAFRTLHPRDGPKPLRGVLRSLEVEGEDEAPAERGRSGRDLARGERA